MRRELDSHHYGDGQQEGKSQGLPFLVAFCAALVVLALGGLIFALNMRRGLNHDEHQFVAAGALMARGLLPYRDFAWFHLPGMAALLALLYGWADHLLLTARVVSIVAATGTLALLMGVALTLRKHAPWMRVVLGMLTLLLLLAAPGFWFASGRAWNHDLAMVLAMGAFLAMCGGLARLQGSRASGYWLVGLAGLLLGAGVSVRLTVAPLALAFVVAPLFWGVRGTRLWQVLGILAASGVIGALPVWLGMASDPQAFLFGNLRYASLNTQWYAAQGADVSLGAKVQAIGLLLVQPGNLLLLGMAAIAVVRAWGAIRDGRAPELRFWLASLPLILLGGVAPTPIQVQYLFALFPWAALGLLLALRHAPPVRWFAWGLAASAVVAGVIAAPRYVEGLEVVAAPQQWYPTKIHARGTFLASMMAAQGSPSGEEWAFTLSPILPLEGGAAIEIRTATGPFAWRIADLVAPEERVRFGLLGSAEMDVALGEKMPRALLTAMHSDDQAEGDAALEGWAREHGYVAVPMPDEGTLWLSPLATWGEIRLGAQTFPVQRSAGEGVAGTLYLQSDAATERNLNLLLRAVNVDGAELFRFDGWPFGSATSTWEAGALWQDGHTFAVPADAALGNYRIEASFYDPETFETLGDVTGIGWIAVIDDDAPSAAIESFGGEIDLLAIEPEIIAGAAGNEVEIGLMWRAEAPQEVDYTRFAHLVDAAGVLIAQQDAPPLEGFYPVSAWRASMPVFDRARVQLPPELPAGEYELRIGLYDPATGGRLATGSGGDYTPIRVQVEGAQE